MANANQLKALVKSHGEGDDARSYSVAMQVAAGVAQPSSALRPEPSGSELRENSE